MGKLTRIRVLRDRAGLYGPQGVRMGQENCPRHARRVGDKVRQNYVGRGENPILHTVLPHCYPLTSYFILLINYITLLFKL